MGLLDIVQNVAIGNGGVVRKNLAATLTGPAAAPRTTAAPRSEAPTPALESRPVLRIVGGGGVLGR